MLWMPLRFHSVRKTDDHFSVEGDGGDQGEMIEVIFRGDADPSEAQLIVYFAGDIFFQRAA